MLVVLTPSPALILGGLCSDTSSFQLDDPDQLYHVLRSLFSYQFSEEILYPPQQLGEGFNETFPMGSDLYSTSRVP